MKLGIFKLALLLLAQEALCQPGSCTSDGKVERLVIYITVKNKADLPRSIAIKLDGRNKELFFDNSVEGYVLNFQRPTLVKPGEVVISKVYGFKVDSTRRAPPPTCQLDRSRKCELIYSFHYSSQYQLKLECEARQHFVINDNIRQHPPVHIQPLSNKTRVNIKTVFGKDFHYSYVYDVDQHLSELNSVAIIQEDSIKAGIIQQNKNMDPFTVRLIKLKPIKVIKPIIFTLTTSDN